MRHQAWAWVALVLLLASSARADDPPLEQAKASFRAGAAAYAAGDYLAAIQALDAAYRATPLPAIAFSLAQAERRQYFVSQDADHLSRAVELYRTYLAQVPLGGRRADAADALAQLEPVARLLPLGAASATAVKGAPLAEKTRLLVTGRAPGARVSLDGGQAVPSPLIAEVLPGPHAVHVEAAGFFPLDRQVVALAGVLVPADVELRERPAVVRIRGAAGADVHVDGRFVGRAEKELRLELASGAHTFIFAKTGHELERVPMSLPRGRERLLTVSLRNTLQRTTSLVLFGSGGAFVSGGAWAGLAALGAEAEATRILRKRHTQNITSQELKDYREAIRVRDGARTASLVSLALGGAALITGLALFELDEPSLADAERLPTDDRRDSRPGFGLAASAEGLGLDARLRF